MGQQQIPLKRSQGNAAQDAAENDCEEIERPYWSGHSTFTLRLQRAIVENAEDGRKCHHNCDQRHPVLCMCS
jgi:cobalamin biosynthesis Mg chelatase CobN